MRPDMKDIIIDVYRRGRNGYSRTSDAARHRLKHADPETLPHFLSNRFVRDSFPNDRLRLFDAFLNSKIGLPWNDTYSEIMVHVDTRNIRGQHLWEHIHQAVYKEPIWHYVSKHYRPHGFFVDEEGILQYNQYWYPDRTPKPVTEIKTGSPNIWFELIEPSEYPARKKGTVKTVAQWYRMVRTITVTRWTFVDSFGKETERVDTKTVVDKKQVNKRTLKRIRALLTNYSLDSTIELSLRR